MNGFTGFLRVMASLLAAFYSGNSVSGERGAMLSPPVVSVSDVNSGSTIERDNCLTVSLGADAAAECGDLRLAHALPGVTTLSKERAPTLLYSSGHASPRGTVRANVTLPDGVSGLSRLVATLTVNGQQRAQSVYKGSAWPNAAAVRIALDYDAIGEPTNVYRYALSVTAHYGETPVTTSVSGDLAVVNRKDSYFGAGWWMAGLDRLILDASAQPAMWIGGDGSLRRYTSAGAGKWSAPALDRPDTVVTDGSGFARLLPGGVKVRFDSQGRHIATRNRLGYETMFTYDATGRLSTITPPLASSGYTFRYDLSGKLSSVDAPYLSGALRTTRFFESRSRVDSIRDADTTTVKFAYLNTTSGRVVKRTNRIGAATTFRYDAAWRVSASRLNVTATDSIVTKLRAGEDIGVADSLGAGAVDTALAYARLDGPRTDVGDTTLFWLDRFGAPKRIRNALGNESVLARGDARFPSLVTQMTAPNGLVTRAWYSARGNVDSTTLFDPYGDGRNATSRYQWDPLWDEATSVTMPEGEVTTFAYDAVNGNRLWQQQGADAARRVCFGYGNSFQLVSSVSAPCGTLSDSVTYDAKGNVASSKTPLGWLTTYERDDIGRETKTIFPIDASHSGYSRSVFDVSDQVLKTIAYGPAMPRPTYLTDPQVSAAADSITLTNVYDKEGNVITVKRTRGVAYTGFAEYTTSYAYDSAGRKISETLQGTTERSALDPAGNLTRLITARGDTTKLTYDALNRLTMRLVPQVTYGPTGCPGAVFGITCQFPEREGPNLCIAADTASFGYDISGNMIRADNGSARVRRAYYSSGALKTDSSLVRSYARPCAPMAADSAFTHHIYVASMTYDLDGRRKTLSHPAQLPPCGYSCPPEQYAYDPTTGALSSVTDVMGFSHPFTYDNSGKLISLSAPGGVSDDYAYDSDDNLRRHLVSGTGFGSLDSLIYDARGKIDTATSSSFGTATITTMYDGLGAVIGEETNSSIDGTTDEMFVVDGLGNRVRRRQLFNDDGGGNDFQHQRLFQYDAFGKLTQMATPSGLTNNFTHTEDYLYDVSGNTTLVHLQQTQDGSTPDHVSHISYYGTDNKLRVFNKRVGVGSASDDSQPGKRGTFDEYRYDALGRRVFTRSRKVGLNCPTSAVDCSPTATRTVWDGDRILYEIRAPGGQIVQGTDTLPDPGVENDNPTGGNNGLAYGVVGYTYGLAIDQPIMVVRRGSTNPSVPNPSVVFPHTGWRGMLALTTNSDGIRNDCPIGGNICEPIDLPGANATVDRGKKVETEPLSWYGSLVSSGAEQSGLQYKRNRFYDPKRGQFTQADPIGLGGGANLYGFGAGDAVNFDDPFGLCPQCLLGAALSVGTGYAIAYLTGADYRWKDAAIDAAVGAVGTGIVRKLGKLNALARSAGDEVFSAAKAGGRNAGFLKNYVGRSASELAKAERSLGSKIAEHEAFLANPGKHVKNWSNLRPAHQQSLINHWKTEIRAANEQIEILRRLP